MLGALLYAQLECADPVQSKRQYIWEYYDERLPEWVTMHHVRLPTIPDGLEQSYHMYHVLLPSLEVRRRLIQHLKERDILAVSHYVPLNTSSMGQQFGYQKGDCPITEDISERLLRLPFYNSLRDEDLQYILAALYAFEDWD